MATSPWPSSLVTNKVFDVSLSLQQSITSPQTLSLLFHVQHHNTCLGSQFVPGALTPGPRNITKDTIFHVFRVFHNSQQDKQTCHQPNDYRSLLPMPKHHQDTQSTLNPLHNTLGEYFKHKNMIFHTKHKHHPRYTSSHPTQTIATRFPGLWHIFEITQPTPRSFHDHQKNSQRNSPINCHFSH